MENKKAKHKNIYFLAKVKKLMLITSDTGISKKYKNILFQKSIYLSTIT